MSPELIAFFGVAILNAGVMIVIAIRTEIWLHRDEKRFGRYDDGGSRLPEICAIVAVVFGLAAVVLSLTSQTGPHT